MASHHTLYRLFITGLFMLCFVPVYAQQQRKNNSQAAAKASYVFYFHGTVVTELGNNAINPSMPEWGPYEYSNILDSLRKRNFIIISEIRKKGVPDSVYIQKAVQQTDSLLKAGIPQKNILFIGASAGWTIVLHAAAQLGRDSIRYVMMGGCWPNDHQRYEKLPLRGRFLSIIEASDPHGTCTRFFENRKKVKAFKEITLHTGLSHGFIYKGYAAWIDPVVEWAKK
jgi:hypothetical protein